MAVVTAATLAGGSGARAADAEEILARHMVGQALLAAHLVAIAESAGMTPTRSTRS